MRKIKVLKYQGQTGKEVRPLYFKKAFGLPIVDARVISFGACNFSCPYCKRDGKFRDDDGSIKGADEIDFEEIINVCDDIVKNNQVIRLSGGDPVVFPETSLEIARYIKEKYDKKISIAHNGSSPEFIKRLLPYLESAAIDLKATPEQMNSRIGTGNGSGERMFWRSIETIDLLADNGILVDIRTPIFATTTLEDMMYLAKQSSSGKNPNNKFWTWRLYKKTNGCDWEEPNIENVTWMIKEVKKIYPELKIGLRAKWEPEGFLYY